LGRIEILVPAASVYKKIASISYVERRYKKIANADQH